MTGADVGGDADVGEGNADAVGEADDATDPRSATAPPDRLGALARLFLKLGFVAFGGPAAHIAMLEEEVVVRRRWVDRQRFLDLVGATNLIPGPNSTEMAMAVGWTRARWPGLVVAGGCFIGPAVGLTLAAAWAYTRWGSVPAAQPFLQGIQAAVLAVIFGALWRLGRKAIRSVPLGAIGVAVAAASLLGIDEIVALLGGGVGGALWLKLAGGASGAGGSDGGEPAAGDEGRSRRRGCGLPWVAAGGTGTTGAGGLAGAAAVGGPGAALGSGVGALAAQAASVPLWKLGLFFLKVGAVLYGSGYVLVAFLEGELVRELAWLTRAELLDAIAIGQFTPGPVLSTSTFVGYLVRGVPGALVATLGIFLPSFLFVAVLTPLVPRLRGSPWTAAFLDSVNASAVGLMAAVTIGLALGALTTPAAWSIAVGAAVASLGFGVSAPWIVLGGAALGGAGSLLGG